MRCTIEIYTSKARKPGSKQLLLKRLVCTIAKGGSCGMFTTAYPGFAIFFCRKTEWLKVFSVFMGHFAEFLVRSVAEELRLCAAAQTPEIILSGLEFNRCGRFHGRFRFHAGA